MLFTPPPSPLTPTQTTPGVEGHSGTISTICCIESPATPRGSPHAPSVSPSHPHIGMYTILGMYTDATLQLAPHALSFILPCTLSWACTQTVLRFNLPLRLHKNSPCPPTTALPCAWCSVNDAISGARLTHPTQGHFRPVRLLAVGRGRGHVKARHRHHRRHIAAHRPHGHEAAALR